jgi:dimethylhistidine N-methyltransferase
VTSAQHPALASERFEFHDFAPVTASFREDVLRGLSQPRKSLPAKYFYDDRGSQLFEAICDLPEYYPTRTEAALMQRYAAEMAKMIGARSLIIEYGSGSSKKTRLLIEAAAPAAYVPIDISRNLLIATSEELLAGFPALHIVAVCADYTKAFALPDCAKYGYTRRVVYFPGSTIGNFDPAETRAFLASVKQVLGAGGVFLVGVDLKKNPASLHAAYNDAQGVTAEFNLNLLHRMNAELGANFDPSAFAHHAFYDAQLGRIEMHLMSLAKQHVQLEDRHFSFEVGETIHTEISCKYGVEEFQHLAREAGLQPQHVWVDDAQLFSVHCLLA